MMQVRLDDEAARVVRESADTWDISLAAAASAIVCEWAEDSSPRTVDVVSPLLNGPVTASVSVSKRRIGR
jgi:hypothetical protein